MSEQELKKWENKFKLFRILHPGQWTSYYCGKCPFLQRKDCSSQPTVLMLKRNKRNIVCIPWSQGSNNKNDIESCVEWLKYV